MNITQPQKNKEIFPFVIAWMDLEGSMLSEISQTRTNTVWSHLYVKSKKSQTHKNRLVVGRALGLETHGDVAQRVRTSSYKMEKF